MGIHSNKTIKGFNQGEKIQKGEHLLDGVPLPHDILRIKGIVFLENIEAPFVFHGVQHVFDPPVQLKNWPKKDRQSRIVVIARNLSQFQLQRSLDMLRIQSND